MIQHWKYFKYFIFRTIKFVKFFLQKIISRATLWWRHEMKKKHFQLSTTFWMDDISVIFCESCCFVVSDDVPPRAHVHDRATFLWTLCRQLRWGQELDLKTNKIRWSSENWMPENRKCMKSGLLRVQYSNGWRVRWRPTIWIPVH